MEGQKIDNVNHPAHYEASTSIECIEAMELIFDFDDVQQFCLCNAFKYIWRHKHKNGLEDLDKAQWYSYTTIMTLLTQICGVLTLIAFRIF